MKKENDMEFEFVQDDKEVSKTKSNFSNTKSKKLKALFLILVTLGCSIIYYDAYVDYINDPKTIAEKEFETEVDNLAKRVAEEYGITDEKSFDSAFLYQDVHYSVVFLEYHYDVSREVAYNYFCSIFKFDFYSKGSIDFYSKMESKEKEAIESFEEGWEPVAQRKKSK